MLRHTIKPTHICNIISSYQAFAIKVQLALKGFAILTRAAYGYRRSLTYSKPARIVFIYWFRYLGTIELYKFHDTSEYKAHIRKHHAV